MMMWRSLDPKTLADLLVRLGRRHVANRPANPNGRKDQNSADPPTSNRHRGIIPMVVDNDPL